MLLGQRAVLSGLLQILRGSGVCSRISVRNPAASFTVARRALSLSVMQKLKAFIHDAKQHVTSCIPISPSRAAAGSATLEENAAPEPRPTQATPGSAASPVQPAASASAVSPASAASPVQPAATAAAVPVQPASSIVVGSQVIRGPDWKWGKQVCRRVAKTRERTCLLHAFVRSPTPTNTGGVMALATALSLCALMRPRAERGLACSSHRMATRAITFRRSALCWKLDRRAGSSCGGKAGCRSPLEHPRCHAQLYYLNI